MDDYEKVEIVQHRGPVLAFEGKLLASTSFPVPAKSMTIDLEVWETRGGALVAAVFSSLDDGKGRQFAEAVVVEPIPPVHPLPFNPNRPISREIDLVEEAMASNRQQMHFAVMDHFGWSDRARSMVRTQLKWRLKWRVE